MQLLGKRAARKDPRNLMLASYAGALPPPPTAVDWTAGIAQWPVSLNDRLGCCTIAGAAHLVQGWTTKASPPGVVLADDVVLAAYEAVSGYDPATGQNDNGAVELDVLKYWRNNGLGASGDKIAAFASVNVQDGTEIKNAIALFGGIYIGLALPLTAQSQGLWDYVPGHGAVTAS